MITSRSSQVRSQTQSRNRNRNQSQSRSQNRNQTQHLIHQLRPRLISIRVFQLRLSHIRIRLSHLRMVRVLRLQRLKTATSSLMLYQVSLCSLIALMYIHLHTYITHSMSVCSLRVRALWVLVKWIHISAT